MRRMIIGLLACGALAGAPAAAEAHSTSWYWSETLAENALESDYSAVITAYCYGRGRSIRTRSGARGYKHFRCYTEMADGSDDAGNFHVTGRDNYRFYWSY